ncbi:MAG: error-prone DNA polymerase, partial [Gammaproteobacteria bacterium]|nr:error-prone DNA polymerase [Gammaproteobacteria bacterium]
TGDGTGDGFGDAGWSPARRADAKARSRPALAVRLGLRVINGLGKAAVERIVAARERDGGDCAWLFEAVSAQHRIESLARAAKLSRADVRSLSAGGALASLAGHRRQAHWAALGIDPDAPKLLHQAGVREALPMLRPPSEGESIVADYLSRGFTLGRHPLALLRPHLDPMLVSTASETRSMSHGTPVRAAGLVINRQRPATASGVLFITLEDDTGHVNLVVWPTVLQAQRAAVLGSRLMGVRGRVQREGEVVHVVVDTVKDLSALLGRLQVRSRDFR